MTSATGASIIRRMISVTVLGTGTMGRPIATNLISAGFRVTVWNRTKARAAPLQREGARLAASPAEAAASANVILTMLADGEAVASAMSGPEGALSAARAGAVWIQMATVGVDWTRRLADLARDAGVEFVDAPVSGSEGPARDGTLVVLASGPAGIETRVAPVLSAVGRKTLWLGPAGTGSKLKLALNNWLATQVEAAAETIALTEALGMDPRVFVDALADTPLGSPYAVLKSNAMLDHEFRPGFPLRHAFKDVRLALTAAGEQGLELPLTGALVDRWKEAIADGHGDDDVASVIVEASTSRLARVMNDADN
jgi:3-hydroxyisobutyrate dehydrogenase